ncbi:hypothetical protein [Microbulbifer guangxiensis]|uniref:hypothetical protein n=1 Tax=Microbulbifer guangxiensis TaxID=2904249 RepID=UPI001F2B7D57|nr:hypothetical protein [Microbulbifer guangxiensis]
MRNKLLALSAASAILCGCAGTSFNGYWGDLSGHPVYPGFPDSTLPLALVPAFPRECLTGDVPVTAPDQCALESGGCYQLIGGEWCTAATASASHCPEGAEVIDPGAECPEGSECWMVSGNLRCQLLYPADAK